MKKETLIIIGSLLAITATVVFLIMPAFDLMSMARQESADAQAQLERIKNFSEKMKQLNEEYNSNPEEIEKLLSILPKEQELPSLLVQLETLADVNGLIMESVDFKEEAKKTASASRSGLGTEDLSLESAGTASQSANSSASVSESYKTLLINLKLSGGYIAFKNYLGALENNVRLMDVSSLNLTSSQDQNQNLTFSFSVSLKVYYQ